MKYTKILKSGRKRLKSSRKKLKGGFFGPILKTTVDKTRWG